MSSNSSSDNNDEQADGSTTAMDNSAVETTRKQFAPHVAEVRENC